MGRRSVALPIRACFRAASKHPLLMVMLCFLAFLYRSFPYVFSLLLYAFPIIFCTGVLLGALLSFSQQKPPETKGEEEMIHHRAVHLKPEMSNNVSVVGSIEEVSSDDDDTSREDDDDDNFEGHCLPIPKLSSSENFEAEIDKSVGSCDSKLVNIDSPPCLGSPTKHEEDEILDSGSESSSPDIVPMLEDELHPLLDEDVPQPVTLSQDDGSDVTSEHFSRSNDSGTESDEEKTELQVEEEDDEEMQGDKDEITKSAIKWTEEDEKNVMEVGSSELERNQLLERVMERRRSRKWVSMMGGKELVNLETSGPPIVTIRRQNPFDILPDSYEEEGLPPIPGSAPSILVPRQNPFDIPYYSNEEKSDLSGENSRLDFLDNFQPKDTFFPRSEFLNVVGPSILQDASHESYFVADNMAPEGTSYSTVYTQQPNGLGESKASSGHETESIGSDEDLEDKNVIKEDIEEKKLIEEPELNVTLLREQVRDASESSEEEEEEESLEAGMARMGSMKNILVDEIVMKLEGPENHHRGVEPFHSDPSSSSPSSSEASERIFVEKSVEERRGSAKDTGISRQPSVDGSELSISTTLVEESQHREPVYDSSPPRLIRRNVSSSSIAFDHDSWFPPIQVKRTVSFAEGVIMMGSNRETEMSIPNIKEILGSSTVSQPVSPNEHKVSKNSLNSQGNIKNLQDQLSSSISEANTQDSLNQTDESISKSSADQEAQDKSPR